MKKFTSVLIVFVSLMMLNLGTTINAQSHADPPFLQIVSAENPITVDGVLDETDWERRYDHLVFGIGALSGDVNYTTTAGIMVDSLHTDSTLTTVKFLHYGLDLYIALESDDKYVNKWGGSWEGDGLFMKIQDAAGIDKEFKLYFNAAGVDPDIVFETNAPEGSGEGAGVKAVGTIVNDTSQIDAGYTAELVIHLDVLGYTDPMAEINVLLNIFDPDGQTGSAGEEWVIGSFYKEWWGSEWGGEYRVLRLADPPQKTAYATEDDIVLDGELTEAFWTDADYVVVGKGSALSTGGWYMQWNHPTNVYEDQSMATVKFMHKGTDLYIGVESDDKSVCKWAPGWEADGLFLWMTNNGEIPDGASRMEVKNMFFNDSIGALAVFEYSATVPEGSVEGASYTPAGTVTHTEEGGEDAGYSLEVVVHTDFFGYSVDDVVNLSVVIWDLDNASSDAWTDSTADYAPNWWGTQWVDPNFEKYFMYRGIHLSAEPSSVEQIDGDVVTSYKLEQNYPNPFNPVTVINYSIPERNNVSLTVYDVLGNVVEEIINEEQNAGVYKATWDASSISSGVYFYTLRTNTYSQTKKMILLK